MKNSNMDKRLKVFFNDPKLCKKYNISQEMKNSMTMTISEEDDIMIILIMNYYANICISIEVVLFYLTMIARG